MTVFSPLDAAAGTRPAEDPSAPCADSSAGWDAGGASPLGTVRGTPTSASRAASTRS